MKLTLFTSNQPRHLALAEALSEVAEELFVVQECNTVFPGRVADFFARSLVMQDYFSRVIAAEQQVFGRLRFLPKNARSLSLKMGDLRDLDAAALRPALEADALIVFGASYIRGALCRELVARRALNLHMGLSPWYRGSSCNFWALYDGRPEMVGATVHWLSEGLDSGDMLLHATPAAEAVDGFVLGMKAVKAGQAALVQLLRDGRWRGLPAVPQEKAKQIRYTRNADFTDAVAAEYLARQPSPAQVERALRKPRMDPLLNPQAIQ